MDRFMGEYPPPPPSGAPKDANDLSLADLLFLQKNQGDVQQERLRIIEE